MSVNLPADLYHQIVALAHQHHVSRLFLFGSRARGTHSEHSDVDLAVDGGDLVNFAADVEEKTLTLLNFDIVDLRQANEQLKQEVSRDGILLMSKFDNYTQAVDSLERMLQAHPEADLDEAAMTGIIAMCNLAFDQCWKTMKELCLDLGAPDEGLNNPRSVLKTAAAYEVIAPGDHDRWLEMLQARNVLTHRYNEDMAKEALQKVRDVYAPLLVRMRRKIAQMQTEIG
ncbi:nucleotidyltransferase substrate binding protein [bacterium]|nr:nucleotidyltransferase substrate binding protein [bacterium]